MAISSICADISQWKSSIMQHPLWENTWCKCFKQNASGYGHTHDFHKLTPIDIHFYSWVNQCSQEWIIMWNSEITKSQRKL